MNISTLCERISLQPEIKSRVIEFANGFDFSSVDKQLKLFRNYERMSEALSELQTILGEDTDNIKILASMLKASADVYEVYKDNGISNEIYFNTMKCYTRFIDETYRMIGKLYFDRYWWTTRQAGCHLFRIGELEFEIKHIYSDIVIGIHIPSDVDFSPSAIDDSLATARQFFSNHYSELSNAEYRCHSWLLDRQLKVMLNENSNILSFQNRFEIFDENDCTADETEFIKTFIEKTEYNDYDKMIQLCDALALPDGATYIEKRLVDVVIRRGFNDLTIPKWKAFLELKDYFDKKTGTDIYNLIGV